jgi:hypothetical protein
MPRSQSGEDLADLLARYSPEVQKLALSTRSLVLKLIPNAIELVDVKQESLDTGTEPSTRT